MSNSFLTRGQPRRPFQGRESSQGKKTLSLHFSLIPSCRHICIVRMPPTRFLVSCQKTDASALRLQTRRKTVDVLIRVQNHNHFTTITTTKLLNFFFLNDCGHMLMFYLRFFCRILLPIPGVPNDSVDLALIRIIIIIIIQK